MSHLLRAVLAILFALWLAIPSPSSEGGENAGGTGVWILPCAAVIPEEGASTYRQEFSASSLQQDLKFAVSNELGLVVATFVDDYSGVAVALPVTGATVTCPSSLVQSIALSPMRSAQILVVDANQLGYVLTVNVDAAASRVTVRVR